MRFNCLIVGSLLAFAAMDASASLLSLENRQELQKRGYCPPASTITKFSIKSSTKTVTKYLKTKTATVTKTKTLPIKTVTKTLPTKTTTRTLPVVTTTKTLPVVTTTKTLPVVTTTTTLPAVTTTTTLPAVTTTTTLPGELTTTTTTAIVSPSSAPDTSCDNGGLEVAIYDTVSGETDFTYIKTKTPSNSALTDILGIVTDVNGTSPHGFSVQDTGTNLYILNYRGYFYAPKTGKYKFQITQPDDAFAFWIREKAFSGWAKGNADGIAYWDPSSGPSSATYELYLTAGEYLPLRLLLQNMGGECGYVFEITSSSGDQYFVQAGVPSPYLVQRPCDANAGSPYPDFGKET
ncbi:hypothetical protein TWF481_011142 [Arthrobotrys musiformis]|uniref:PA14 domain-containing protein n=1 Tax=Arthrobotrys musiformis TaxID=47236 RepID=A0AAV9VXK6_9PEZI